VKSISSKDIKLIEHLIYNEQLKILDYQGWLKEGIVVTYLKHSRHLMEFTISIVKIIFNLTTAIAEGIQKTV